ELKTNFFGTIHGSFLLAEGAALGDYKLEINLEGEVFEGRFKVQDYRKPDYQVVLSSDAATYVQGDEFTVNVSAEYLFGEPVGDAEVTIREYELGEFYGYWWEEDTGDQDVEYVWFESPRNAAKGKTNADGDYTYHSNAILGQEGYRTTFWGSSQMYSTWGIEVTVDDGSHQTVSNFIVLKVYDAAEKISLSTSGYIHTPGSEFTMEARADSIEDQPVSNRSLSLEIMKWDNRYYDYETVLETLTATTDENGVAHLPLTLNENGHYKLTLSAQDARGLDISTTRWIGIYDFDYPWMNFNASDELTLWAEQDSYSPYQTANLFIQSSFDGPAILTIERGKVHRAQEVELTSPITQVQVPILASDAPNVFVTINAWQPESTALSEYEFSNKPESRLHFDTIELHIDSTDGYLDLEIETDREAYQPGEDANITIRVTDSQGKPVRAEVSLALVDEGIYALSEVLVDPITEAFYGPRELDVHTFDSMSPWREIYSPGRGGGGGDGGVSPGSPRSAFKDTAAWFPTLTTDSQGELTLTVPLPDNLTTWRLTARAVTTNSLVGETTASIITHRAVVVRPILPGSLTSGDQFTLTALVHNYSESQQSMAIKISSDLLEITDPALVTRMVPAGESVTIGWAATAAEAGDAQVTISAEGDGVADFVQQTLTIQPLAVPEVTTQVGSIEDEYDTVIFLPPDALDQSSVHIELSRSIDGNVLSGLEYLTGYPYGCVEQIMSKALPNAVVGRALFQLGSTDQASLLNLEPKITAGLQMLYAMQHQDGGWGWWYDDQTHDYQTAWVVFGLATTAEAGYAVDKAAILRGVDWLQENLATMDPRTKAFALFSMATAGHGDRDATLTLYEYWIKLDTFSQAALAIALDELDASEAAGEILGFLEDSALLGVSGAYWPSPQLDGHYYKKTMSSTTRSTALALSAFTRLDPDNELIPEIVRWLMSQRKTQGWGTTNETSFTLLALSDYLLATQKAEGETYYQVELDGETIQEGTLTADHPMQSIDVRRSQLKSGINRLKIYNADADRLYFVVSTQLYLSTTHVEAAGSIEITRDYRIFGSSKPIEAAAVGDVVQVILNVDVPEASSYVIIEDKLPGGLEALNEGLNTTSHVVDYYGNAQYSWKNLGYNYKEIHKDRVSFFVTELKQGRHQFSYYSRVMQEGTFLALPAEAYEMYNLANWGRSASDTLQFLSVKESAHVELTPVDNRVEVATRRNNVRYVQPPTIFGQKWTPGFHVERERRLLKNAVC
ncbi:MAG: alpha-2-macroglobulin family protein, partial [Anaerolineales bacterium]